MPLPKTKTNFRHSIALALFSAFLIITQLAIPPANAAEPQGEWIPCPNTATDEFISNTITALETDDQDRLWVGTDVGLTWTENNGRTWNPVDLTHASPLDIRKPSPRLTPMQSISRNSITSIKAGPSGVWVGTLNGLCLLAAKDQKWRLMNIHPLPLEPRIWGVDELGGEIWVSAETGLHRSIDGGASWETIARRFPKEMRSVTLIPKAERVDCWLTGFDAPRRAGGGPDILYTEDKGKSWSSLKSQTASNVSSAVSAHVNRLAEAGGIFWACTRHGLARSRTMGKTWYRVRRVSGLEADQVFDIVEMWDRLWLGTSTGLFSSRDNGRTWIRDRRIWSPVRRIVSHGRYLWLATSGGLLRRTRGGETETFSIRQNVLSLAMATDRTGETWWAGSTGGLSFTRDKGKTWRTLTVNDGLPSNLVLTLETKGGRVWAGTDGGIWSGTEGAKVSRRYGIEHGLRGLVVYDIHLTDTKVYAATNRGLSVLSEGDREWRTFLSAKSWRAVWIIDKTVYGAVFDPDNVTGGMSLIRGNTDEEKWETIPLTGHNGAPIHQLLEVGGELWAATDRGLFRSRDQGTTWARFASESLWASRITRLAKGEKNLLCVQAVPNDPPSMSGTAFLNMTQDNGRSWRVLTSDIPGHANAIMANDEMIIVGTRFGVSYYPEFYKNIRSGLSGRLAWYRIAGLAASTTRRDKLGHISCVDRYAAHGPSLWFASMGMGAIERGIPTLDEINPAWDTSGQSPVQIQSFAAMPSANILAAADSPDGIWFGTENVLAMYDRLSSWTTWYPGPKGPRSAPIRALATRDREIWVGTDTGLSVMTFPDNQWTFFDTENSPLPNNHVTALACDGDKVWGGTEQGGFMVDRNGSWKVFLTQENISSLALGSARKYFATNQGIFSLDNEGAFRKRWHSGNTLLRDNDVQKVFVDGPEIWAASTKGIRKILYDRAEPSAFPEIQPSLRDPKGVLVVVNDLSEGSIRVGQAYQKLRGIPPENMCHIRSTTSETINRATYEDKIRKPIWRHLRDNKIGNRISFIVTTFGVPLRIKPDNENSRRFPERSTRASVDSELTLLSREHPLPGGITNLYIHREDPFDSNCFDMYLVTRLDGPTPEAAIDLATKAVEVEKTGSFAQTGFARFDVYPIEMPRRERYHRDERLNAAIESNYRELRNQSRLHGRVTVPERTLKSYNRAGSGLNTFFFIGHGEPRYTSGVFTWNAGAVALCLEPKTASTMRDSTVSWVAGAVQEGVTTSMGTVYDPGDIDVIVPNNLYHYLRIGFTWAEAAYMCLPQLSGQMVVIGDPLYTPIQ